MKKEFFVGFGLSVFVLLVSGCEGKSSPASPGSPVADTTPPTPTSPVVATLPSESGSIQIDHTDSQVFVLNQGNSPGSLSIFQVKEDDQDTAVLLGTVEVGQQPNSVSVNPDATRAYVSNEIEGTISVIDVVNLQLLTTIPVGSEPRGTALSPTGKKLYVANYSDGSLSVINTETNAVTKTLDLTDGSRSVLNPYAVAVSNDKDDDDTDETIYVTDFFGRVIPGTPIDTREAFDNSKEGRVAIISAGSETVTRIATLSPMDSGFTADRTQFDPANNSQAKTGNPYIAPAGVDATKVPQNGFFNQLFSISVDPKTGNLYVTSIAAQPEPPVKFNVNVQPFIGVINPAGNEIAASKVNLHNLIKVETQPNPPFNKSLTRAFSGDTVDMAIRNEKIVFISRAGSYAMKGAFDSNGVITLGNSATTPAVRYATGNIPTGVAINSAGTRAYVNAEVDATLTSINLETDTVLSKVESVPLPSTGTTEHKMLIGKLAFFTGMGVDPGVALVNANVREIDTHLFRNIASDNNWSSCASCHYAGTHDGVTWSFPTGPRQTPSLDASFGAGNSPVQRVFLWNAARSSVTDFNNNTRNVQGGFGFTPLALTELNAGVAQASVSDRGRVFNHGPNQGISDALDLMTLWIQRGVRTFNAPSNLNATSVSAGQTAFETLQCAACHGGELWTSSRVRWTLPLFASDPLAGSTTAHVPLDPRVQNLNATNPANGQFIGTVLRNYDGSSTADGVFETPIVTRFLGDVTLSLADDLIELRGTGGQIGQNSVGAAGSFNPPSLLMLHNTAPYGHHGRAQTLEEVFKTRADGGLGHPTFGANTQQLADLIAFLKSIDSKTAPVASSTTKAAFMATLTGAQEVPAVTTTASGTGSFALNSAKTELTFTLSVSGLSGPMTAAHFHNAATGANGGAVRTITEFSGNTATGVWKSTDAQPLTSALVTELTEGRIYVNIHTAANSGGEIRGQVLATP